MAQRTPVVVNATDTGHVKIGSGDTITSTSIPVSMLEDNGITANADGLYAKKAPVITSSKHTVFISDTDGNVDLNGQSLLTRDARGEFQFNVTDNKFSSDACGPFGSGVYWRKRVELSQVGTINSANPLTVWTMHLPCTGDGRIISHRLIRDPQVHGHPAPAKPTVDIWLICDEVPTHLYDLTNNTITQITRSTDSTNTGLPDFPIAADGEDPVQPQYVVEYAFMDYVF